MKYKPYDAYKDSGIEWIGDIPQDWEVKKLKYIITLYPKCDTAHLSDNDNVTFLPMDCVKNGYFENQAIEFSQLNSSYNQFENNDILLAKVTPCFENGNIAIAKELFNGFGFGSSELFVLRCINVHLKYMYYYFQSSMFVQMATGTMYGAGGLKRISSYFMSNNYLAVPATSDQVAIADYLDVEIAKIANIISAKQKLIEKLQEKRSSIISHAVTKGLDPTANMKPSGIEWIGDIPEGWELKKLKYVSTVSTGNTPSKNVSDFYCDDGLAWVKPDNLNEFIPIKETKEYLSESGVEVSKIAKAKSVLVCCIGTVGKFGYSLNDVAYNQQINAITFNDKINWKYGLYYLSCQQEQHRYFMNGNVVYILNSENQKQIITSVPPLTEQTTIVNYLDAETAKIDDIIEKTKTSIEKLNEYKTALISACVTGKIDVRGQQNEQAN